MNLWEKSGLVCRYEKMDGNTLVVECPEGKPQDVLVEYQVRMLEANKLRHFVPMHVEYWEEACSLRYRLEGKRKFSAVFPTVAQKDEKAWNVLLAMADALNEGKDYLLREEGIVIHPDWIWTDSECREFEFFYMPVRTIRETHLWDQWHKFFRFLERNGVSSALLDPLRLEQWTVNSFSLGQAIERIQKFGVTRDEGVASVEKTDGDVLPAAPELQPPCPPAEPTDAASHGQSAETALKGSVVGIAYSEAEDGETMRLELPRFSWKEWASAAVSLIAWMTYAIFLSNGWLLVAIGASVPLFAMLKARYRPSLPREEGAGENPSLVGGVHDSRALWEEGTTSAANLSNPVPLAERTTMFHEPQKTVFLDEHIYEQPSAKDETLQFVPYLEIRAEGKERVEYVAVHELPFRIGRGPEGVHFAVEHGAASRAHLEIRREAQGSYTALDTGSRNGSFMNNEPMVPYQPMPLQEGDVLRIPGAEIVFFGLTDLSRFTLNDRRRTAGSSHSSRASKYLCF